MRELIVGGKDNVTYIITANGKKQKVKKGEKVKFKNHEEAMKALEEVRTLQGEPLFYFYESIENPNVKELEQDGENRESSE